MAQVLEFTGSIKRQGIRPAFAAAFECIYKTTLYDTNAERFRYLASRVYTGELSAEEAGLIAKGLGVRVERFDYDS